MEISAKEAMESHISISARTSVDSTHGGDGAPETLLSTTATPISPPRTARSHDSVTSQARHTTAAQSTTSTPLRVPLRKFPATPSTQGRASLDAHTGVSDYYHREDKTPASLLSLSDYNGSEDSHTERRFLRQYEELESHCKGNPPQSSQSCQGKWLM